MMLVVVVAALAAPRPVRAQAAAPPAAPLSAFATRKAEALLRDHLPCLGCHSLRGSGGRIGPDLTTVRERRSAAWIEAVVTDPQRVNPASAMPRPLLPSATRQLVVRYLQSLPGSGPDVAPPVTATPAAPPAPPDGPALYQRWCASCHGAKGEADGPNAAFLPVAPTRHASAAVMRERSDDALFDTISGGGAIMNRSPRMPPFGGTLAPAEIRALVAWLRALCRCEGPAWSRDGRRERR